MSLCPRCRKPIPDAVDACPACGTAFEPVPDGRAATSPPSDDSTTYATYLGVGVAAIVLVLVISTLMGSSGRCTDCKSRGRVYCTDCRGGKTKCVACNGSGLDQQTFSTCATCRGAGIQQSTCRSCNGSQQRPCPACGGSGRRPH